MIDLHAHILHGLDDGPRTLKESVVDWRRPVLKMVTEYPQSVLDGRRPKVLEPIPI